MPLKLTKTLRREIEIDGETYTVAVGPGGVKVTAKGFRKGRELSWRAILSLGESDARHGLRDLPPDPGAPQRNSPAGRQ